MGQYQLYAETNNEALSELARRGIIEGKDTYSPNLVRMIVAGVRLQKKSASNDGRTLREHALDTIIEMILVTGSATTEEIKAMTNTYVTVTNNSGKIPVASK